MRSALMICLHRLPSDNEIASLPRVALTSAALWEPQKYYDDDDVIYPLNTATFQAFSGYVPIAHTLHDTALRLIRSF
jgi:hypothetical protein